MFSILFSCLKNKRFITGEGYFKRMARVARVWNEKTMQGLKHEEVLRKCTDCGSEDVIYDNGELYCNKCGLVLD